MKSFFRSVVFGFAVVSVLGATSASASSLPVKNVVMEVVSESLDGEFSVADAVKVGVHCGAGAMAMPTAVAGASALGVTASTGTAISTLSGAAAVSATSAAIGAPAAAALSAVGVAVAPAVAGGAIIVAGASLVAYGINSIFFDED